jgi:hypothetical protein
VIFALFTKIFAVNEGLLPEDFRFTKAYSCFSLEIGLLIGGFLVLTGLAASAYALGFWGRQSFGPLDPVQTLRTVIPAVTALALGCEILLSSFFLSILSLKRRRD